MRRGPTNWVLRIFQALLLLLVIAFGAREVWVLLSPLLPVLIALAVLVVVYWIIRRGWW